VNDQTEKRGRGRPPKHGEAMTAADRQRLYAKARARDMAEVAYALKDVLARTKANQKVFSDNYRGTTSSTRLRRGLAQLLAGLARGRYRAAAPSFPYRNYCWPVRHSSPRTLHLNPVSPPPAPVMKIRRPLLLVNFPVPPVI
jgi:hypothetical protein